LDKKVISAPVIRSRISNRGQITGYFTPEEARDLAVVLRAGALPTDLHILQERRRPFPFSSMLYYFGQA